MRRRIRSAVLPLIVALYFGCGEHDPGIVNGDPPPTGEAFGNETFFPSGMYFYDDGIQAFLLQSDRLISIQFDSAASNSTLRQFAQAYGLLLYPGLTQPDAVDWDTEKRRISFWVVPESADIFEYYTQFPRDEDDESFFGWHPLVRRSLPSYADMELRNRYFISDRFIAFAPDEIAEQEIDEFNAFNGVAVTTRSAHDHAIEYRLRLTDSARHSTLQMANNFHESMFYIEAYPEFTIIELAP